MAAAVAALVVLAVPAEAHGETGEDCEGARFTATAQADLAKITVLDAGVLRPDLPALADVRLASARGSADSDRRPHRTVATGRYADAKLLGLRVPGDARPGTGAVSRAPAGIDARARVGSSPAPDSGKNDENLVGVNAGGLATLQLGKSTADARWDDAYRCGDTGPLTRSATMLAGAQFLGGGGATPAIRAMRSAGAGEPTSLLRLGPTGSTQSATDLVRKQGRLAVTAAAGVALSDLTLFAGTPQEVSVKVVTQPSLTVTTTGNRAHDEVDYRPAVLEVTAAGKPVATLDTREASVGVELLGGLTTSSLLSAKISLGGPRQERTGDSVRAEAAAVRVEVLLGRAHLLDVALGYLFAEASAPPLITVPVRAKRSPATFEKPAAPAMTPPPPATPPPAPVAAPAPRTEQGVLALTGANVAAAAAGGLLLIVVGLAAVVLTRRRRH
ncbi:hypothetical protein [Paractinoplanes lichenicola]|uniref:Gram-positive cocci surface proteins LPxTG domain-containing protein n=1 Tax=Paractinoplanes lichenicola TaxID=2802976 RepID=A0ABS1VUM6_9ACTN|nr:hypothetical protein [Actinoplanes lichenicola]MBL7258191.1 hypothetical protein [Actinoplanes lichenicola]